MPLSLSLRTTPWQDHSLEELAQKANEWGYQGLEVVCTAEHLAVQRALGESAYCQQLLDLLDQQELRLTALSNPAVGQAMGDRPDPFYQRVLPDYVWGDGSPEGVQERAAGEMIATVRVAQKLGGNLVVGATGSPLTPFLFDCVPFPRDLVEGAYRQFGQRWQPVLDVCREASVRFALEVRPGQMAFDLYSAEQTLHAVQGHASFGFAINPAYLHWQGMDPVEFVRAFPERIFMVVACDAIVTLNGRNGILGSHLPRGDHRRGWCTRCPGHGSVDWASLVRVLHEIGFDGPMSVMIDDPGMDRNYAAADAAPFLRRLDFLPAARGADAAFGDAQ